ncbi:MAG: YraN family protein [Oscillochloridaceae bacterium umkhey_bin13]
MPSVNQDFGQAGERAAAAHLRRAGFTIMARNWRCAHGELDLVAQRGDLVVFVEVKTRRVGPWSPESAITQRKSQHLLASAYAYLDAHTIPVESSWRIDLIAIEVAPSGQIVRLEQIEHVVTGDGALGL